MYAHVLGVKTMLFLFQTGFNIFVKNIKVVLQIQLG